MRRLALLSRSSLDLKLVAEEIPAIISQRYGIPLDQGHWVIGWVFLRRAHITGHSRRYPERFASVSVVSGFFDHKGTFVA